MAALVLSVAGAAAGAVFGPAGAIVGRIAGALVGNIIDQKLFGPGDQNVVGPRLADLDVMASTEGAPIPRVYGRARLAGQVIWATQLEEVVSNRTSVVGRQGPSGVGAAHDHHDLFLFRQFRGRAVRRPDRRRRADLGRRQAARPHRHKPSASIAAREEQAADDLIVAKEGAGNSPAYRGLAYVVFERLPLADFGNRIPQLSFEIIRPVGQLERMVRAVTLIPGTTEFGYEPSALVSVLAPGTSAQENRHVSSAASDVQAALDDLIGRVSEPRTRRAGGGVVRRRPALRPLQRAARRRSCRKGRQRRRRGRWMA